MGKNGKARADDRAWKSALATLHEAQLDARATFDREFEKQRDKAVAQLNDFVSGASAEVDAVRTELRCVVEQSLADAQMVKASRAEAVTVVASLEDDVERLQALSGELRANLEGEAARSLDEIRGRVVEVSAAVQADAEELRAELANRTQGLRRDVELEAAQARDDLRGQVVAMLGLVEADAQQLRAQMAADVECVHSNVSASVAQARDDLRGQVVVMSGLVEAAAQELRSGSSERLQELVAVLEADAQRLREQMAAEVQGLRRDVEAGVARSRDDLREQAAAMLKLVEADAQVLRSASSERLQELVAVLEADAQQLREQMTAEVQGLRRDVETGVARSRDDLREQAAAMLGLVEADAQVLRSASAQRLQELVSAVEADTRAASALHQRIEDLTDELDIDTVRARLETLVGAVDDDGQRLRAETAQHLEELVGAVARRCALAADEAVAKSGELLQAAVARGQELSEATGCSFAELVSRAEAQLAQTRDDMAISAGRLLDGMEADAQVVQERRSQIDDALRAVEAGAKELEAEYGQRVRSLLEESEAHASRIRDASNHADALRARADAEMRSIGQDARQQAVDLVAQVESDLHPARSQVAELQRVITELEAASVAFDEELTRVWESLEVRVDDLLAEARLNAETEIARSISERGEMQECGEDTGSSGGLAASLDDEPVPDADPEAGAECGSSTGAAGVEAEIRAALDFVALGGDAVCTDDEDELFFTTLAAELRDSASDAGFPQEGERDGAWLGLDAHGSVTEVQDRVDPGAFEELPSHTSTTPTPAPETDPIEVHVSAEQLASCAQQLVSSGPDQLVRLELRRTVSQRAGYGYLGLTTYDPRGWWECNGLAVSANVDETRSIIVDLHDLLSVLASLSGSEGPRGALIDWRGAMTIGGGHVLVAADPMRIPALSSDRKRVEHVYLSDAVRSGCVLETQIGRLHISADLGEHLHERNVRTAELVMVSGEPFLSARTNVAVDGGAAPLILAPLELLMRDDPVPATRAIPVTPAPERRGRRGDEITELLLALSPTASVEDLLEVLNSGVGYTRRRAAMHPALPEDVISDLISEGTEAMRAAAAVNVSIGPEASRRAAADISPVVRMALASNPSVPVDVLEQVAVDPDPAVRATVAGNRVTPGTLVDLLSRDPEPSVRAAVAANDGVDADLLCALAQDEDPMVCRALTGNPRCPREVLVELSGAFPDHVLTNPNAPRVLLAAGAHVAAANLRAKVAANPATPLGELRRLAHDDDYHVLRAIAAHPRTPPKARRRARRRLMTQWGEAAEWSVEDDAYPAEDAVTGGSSDPFSNMRG